MIGDNIIKAMQKIASEYVAVGDAVVDATCGNGFDTLFLSKLVGNSGYVYAFDIQQEAINNTSKLLKEKKALENVKLILDSHANIKNYSKKASFIVFNLGYLPSSNKEIMTEPKETLKAIKNCFDILEKGGCILLVVYTGHATGKIESLAIEDYVKRLSPKEAHVVEYKILNRNNAPYIITIEKK